MSTFFKYSILRYVHSAVLGEVLNVGILFFFPEKNHIAFKHPAHLGRIRGVYDGDFSENLVGNILKGLSKKVEQMNKTLQNNIPQLAYSDIDNFINHNLLLEDSTVLQFDNAQTAFSDVAIEVTIKEYYYLLFSHYHDNKTLTIKHNEEFISKKFQNYLSKKDQNYLNFISKNVELNVPDLPDGKFNFEFTWNNHVQHLVKPVSFDLTDSKNITQKAAAYFGYLSCIAPILSDKKIDLLLTRPQDKDLFSAYDKAIRLLDNVVLKKELIEQEELEKYADIVLSEAER